MSGRNSQHIRKSVQINFLASLLLLYSVLKLKANKKYNLQEINVSVFAGMAVWECNVAKIACSISEAVALWKLAIEKRRLQPSRSLTFAKKLCGCQLWHIHIDWTKIMNDLAVARPNESNCLWGMNSSSPAQKVLSASVLQYILHTRS